jgi:hypothetical protein
MDGSTVKEASEGEERALTYIVGFLDWHALHTEFPLVLVRSSSSSINALHSQEVARCGNIVQFIGL